jgi:2,5-diamino-6-(ribosylamino)-4(3H)-pyrimidinone 5'-phosphate reductase
MKPYIICHMMASVDGRIDCAMTSKIKGVNEYYRTLDALDAPTTVSGRITATLEMAAQGFFEPKDQTAIGKTSFHKAAAADGYTVIVDNKGRLKFNGAELDGQPLLLIVSEKASKEYLSYLEHLGISWIACGKGHTDLKQAVEIMDAEFGVERMVIVGGPHINGAFLSSGILDEVSVLYGPAIDGREGMPGIFDGLPKDAEPIQLRLKSVEQYPDGAVWMRYLVRN